MGSLQDLQTTSGLVEQKALIIAERQDKHLADRQTLLMQPAVQWKLNSTDLAIANAAIEIPIRKITDQDLLPKIGTMVKFLCRDIGVAYWHDAETIKYDAARFFDTVRKYYNDLSIKQIKMAFELAQIGELDDWLPKDKNGNPDNKHYNNFNVGYYTKILKAFRAKNSRVWNKARKALPHRNWLLHPSKGKKTTKRL